MRRENLEKICNLAAFLIQKNLFYKKKNKEYSQKYLINLMSNLLDIESFLKRGNNPISVFTENLINLI